MYLIMVRITFEKENTLGCTRGLGISHLGKKRVISAKNNRPIPGTLAIKALTEACKVNF